VDNYDVLLDPGFKGTDDLKAMLLPYEPSQMKRYPVSTRVNLVKNDDPECSAEVKEQSRRPSPLVIMSEPIAM
jgi:putative SOS response-associated peptidase YedK